MLILTLKDPKLLGYLKQSNLLVWQKHAKRTYRNGIYVCAPYIGAERKKISKIITKNCRVLQFKENAKLEVVGVGLMTLS